MPKAQLWALGVVRSCQDWPAVWRVKEVKPLTFAVTLALYFYAEAFSCQLLFALYRGIKLQMSPIEWTLLLETLCVCVGLRAHIHHHSLC